MNLLDLFIKIGIDDQASDGLDTVVGNAKKVASGIGTGLANAAKVGTAALSVATGAMTALTKAGLDASGELEQNSGGLMQVFKEQAADMEKTAGTAFENMGLSASDFMATANRMGALFQGSGFGIAESATLAQEAMQRAADVASIMGLDVSAAMEAVTGAAKGNFTMMDNLGVAINDTTLQQYALAQGITTSTREMTTQQKVGLAMELFMEKSAYAAGNYARENETLAGSLTTAGAAMQNFLSGAGSADALVSSFSNATSVITSNIVEIVPRLASGLSRVASQLAPQISSVFSRALPAITEGATSLLQGVAGLIPSMVGTITEQLPAVARALGSIGGILLDGLPVITTAFSQVGVTLAGMIETTVKDLTGIDLSPVADVFKTLADTIGGFFDGLAGDVDKEGAVSKINALIEGISGAVTGLVKSVGQSGAADAFGKIIGFVGAFTADMAETMTPVASAVQNLLGAFAGEVPGIIGNITEKIGGFFGLFSDKIKGPLGDLAENVSVLLGNFTEVLPGIVGKVSEGLGTFFGWFSETTAELVAKIVSGVSTLVENWQTTISVLTGVVAALAAYKTAMTISTIIDSVKKALNGMTLAQNASAAAQAVLNAVMNANPFVLIVSLVAGVVTALVTFVATNEDAQAKLKDIWEKIKESFTKAAEAIKTGWNSVLTFFSGLPDKILGFFSGIGTKFMSIGTSIVDGIKSGISNAWNTVTDFVEGCWDGLIGKSKEVNEVNSPSRVYYRIGHYLGEGLQLGWSDAFRDFERDVANGYGDVSSLSVTRIPFGDSAIGRSSTALSSFMTAGSGMEGAEFTANLILDGEIIAKATFDPLGRIAKQKGVFLTPIKVK